MEFKSIEKHTLQVYDEFAVHVGDIGLAINGKWYFDSNVHIFSDRDLRQIAEKISELNGGY